MATSVNDLKERLREYLTDPKSEHDFRVWLAFAVRDAHKSEESDFEPFVQSVERAFSEAADGTYTPEELRSVLADLAFESHVDESFRMDDSSWVLKKPSRSLRDYDPDEVVFNP